MDTLVLMIVAMKCCKYPCGR